jgi:hypothetical protein
VVQQAPLLELPVRHWVAAAGHHHTRFRAAGKLIEEHGVLASDIQLYDDPAA